MDLRKQATLIAERKAAVLVLLKPEQRETVRGQGSEYAKTWEDFAREKGTDGVGPENYQIRRLLASYHEALNALYLWAYEQGKHVRAVRTWASKQKPRIGDPEKLEEAEAEAAFALRRVCATWKGELGAAYGAQNAVLERMFEQYLHRCLFRALDEWLVRSSSPVEVPQKAVARKGRQAAPTVVPIDELLKLEAGEDA